MPDAAETTCVPLYTLTRARISEFLDYASDYGEFDENTSIGTASQYNGDAMCERRRATIIAYKKVLGLLPLDYIQQPINDDLFIWRWIERGMFDPTCTRGEALNVIACFPTAPWNSGHWDVEHKPYAEAFYERFPDARKEQI